MFSLLLFPLRRCTRNRFSRKPLEIIHLGTCFVGLFCTCPSRNRARTSCTALTRSMLRFNSPQTHGRLEEKQEKTVSFCSGGIATKALSHAVLIIAAEHIGHESFFFQPKYTDRTKSREKRRRWIHFVVCVRKKCEKCAVFSLPESVWFSFHAFAFFFCFWAAKIKWFIDSNYSRLEKPPPPRSHLMKIKSFICAPVLILEIMIIDVRSDRVLFGFLYMHGANELRL